MALDPNPTVEQVIRGYRTRHGDGGRDRRYFGFAPGDHVVIEFEPDVDDFRLGPPESRLVATGDEAVLLECARDGALAVLVKNSMTVTLDYSEFRSKENPHG